MGGYHLPVCEETVVGPLHRRIWTPPPFFGGGVGPTTTSILTGIKGGGCVNNIIIMYNIFVI